MLRRVLRRFGIGWTAAGFTVLAVLLATGITACVNAVWGAASPKRPYVIAVLAPALITPVLASLALRLISQLDEAEQRLLSLANVDDLTQCYNRRYFMPHADRELQRAQSSGQPLAIAITDFDNFKTINDSHGHQAGDEVLRELARLFRSQARRADVLARYGGDEFVLLFPNTDRDEVRAWADRITAALAATSIRAQGVSIKPALSIGAAALDGQPASLDDLLKRADVALYEAKQQGGGRFVLA